MSENLIGKTLDGRFVLEEVLGTGATGAVFRATQSAVDRVVAVKLLHPQLQDKEDFQSRFEIEAKAIARLNHPNLITLYDFGYDEALDVFYMALEFVDGLLLADMMNEAVPYDDVMAIGYQVADALDHAHREGILHRDLKPENIMIERNEEGRPVAKMLDFGLARLYELDMKAGEESPSGRYKQITKTGQVYGTPAYMSPEQCRATSELTAATDIYALGTMLYELLEGQLPFSSQSTAELILMQMTEEPPKMKRLDVPPDIKKLIHAMMQKDPQARPQSTKIVKLALLAHVRLDAGYEVRHGTGEYVHAGSGEHAVVATMSGSELSAHELSSTRTSNRAMIGLVAGAVLLGFIGAVVLMSVQGDDGPQAAVVVDEERGTGASSVDEGASVAQAGISEEHEGEPATARQEDGVQNEPSQRPEKKKGSARTSKKRETREDEKESGGAKTLKLTY